MAKNITHITKATIKHAKAIYHIISQYASQDILLSRSLNDIYESIQDFYVYTDNQTVVGCAALHVVWEHLAELRSMAILPDHQGHGIGKQLVYFSKQEAKRLGVSHIFLLTYEDLFFKQFGFKHIDKSELPHKIWTDCIHCTKFSDCNEIAMICNINDTKIV